MGVKKYGMKYLKSFLVKTKKQYKFVANFLVSISIVFKSR